MAQDAQNLMAGRYSVLEKLGEGAFGSVVKAYDTRLKRTVAVKVLKRTTVTAYPDRIREVEERFLREAEAGARIGSHPNVVSVYDLIDDAMGTVHLILEYIAGGTLAQRIQDGPIPLETALRWTADAARGLQAAHAAGIVHRDVKPANIYIASDERALIGDFGIAQIDTLSRRTATTFTHPGTPLYMSPEQTQSTGYVRPSSDQYSLGLVVFEMIIGASYKRFEPGYAATLLGSQPGNVSHLIARMTTADPQSRYPGMMEVVAAVQAIERSIEHGAVQETIRDQSVEQRAASETVQPMRPGAPEKSGPPPGLVDAGMPPRDGSHREPTRLHRRAVFTAIAGLVATSASGGLWLGLRNGGGSVAVSGLPAATTAPPSATSAPAAAPPGNTPAPTSAAPTSAAAVRSPVAPAATTAPSPTPPAVVAKVVFPLTGHTDSVVAIAFAPDSKTVATGSADTTARIWGVSDGLSLHGGLSHPAAVRSVAFSPDGKLLATGAADNQVRLLQTVNGQIVRPYLGHKGVVNSVAFSPPDGQILASGSTDKTIKLWRVTDVTNIRTLTGHDGSVLSIAFSPDGQMIASGSADRTIRFWRVNDGTPIPTAMPMQHADDVNSVAFTPDGMSLVSVSTDKVAKVWRVSDGTLIHGHATHPGPVFSVAVAPNGNVFATGSSDKTVRMWRMSDAGLVGSLDDHTDSVRGVAFSPDGKLLATASADKTGRLWSLTLQ